MSSILTQARARALRPPRESRPRLTIVPRAVARTPRVPFVVLVVSLMAAGLIGLLLLNTALERGAYQVTGLQRSADALTAREQVLQMQVASLQNPQRVAEKATALGMVRNDRPAFLSLATGQVIGKAAPAREANKVDIGHPAPGVHRPGKVAPPTAGKGNHLFTPVSHAQVVAPPSGPAATPGAATKSPDTRGASTKPASARDTTNGRRSHR